MTTPGGRADQEGPERPATLATSFLAAMRRHDRAAVLLHHDGVKWREIPDWRLERHVIRFALFLRDRARLAPGERVAIVSRLRPEAVVAELAAIAQGVAAVTIDPDLPPESVSRAIEEAAPAVAFVPDAPARDRFKSARAVVCFEGKSEGAWAFHEALDLGGTLDTPERAQSFRAQAREVPAESHALGYVVGTDGASSCQFLSHAESVARMRALRAELPARKGAVALVAAPPTLPARLALLSFVFDGSTTCAVGMPGREVAGLLPDWVVGPAGAPESARPAGPAPRRAGARGLFGRFLVPFRGDPRDTKAER
jgi:acyl-CoA synthetase (AMP-forming)/AMP-acid ligase II